MNINKKNRCIEFSKILCALIAGLLFIYAIYAGLAFYSQVTMYYETVNNAIQAGTEYVSISQPDPTLAITCVTCILASFLTYCLYQFGLKNSLNMNNLSYDSIDGFVKHISTENVLATFDFSEEREDKISQGSSNTSKKVNQTEEEIAG